MAMRNVTATASADVAKPSETVNSQLATALQLRSLSVQRADMHPRQ